MIPGGYPRPGAAPGVGAPYAPSGAGMPGMATGIPNVRPTGPAMGHPAPGHSMMPQSSGYPSTQPIAGGMPGAPFAGHPGMPRPGADAIDPTARGPGFGAPMGGMAHTAASTGPMMGAPRGVATGGPGAAPGMASRGMMPQGVAPGPTAAPLQPSAMPGAANVGGMPRGPMAGPRPVTASTGMQPGQTSGMPAGFPTAHAGGLPGVVPRPAGPTGVATGPAMARPTGPGAPAASQPFPGAAPAASGPMTGPPRPGMPGAYATSGPPPATATGGPPAGSWQQPAAIPNGVGPRGMPAGPATGPGAFGARPGSMPPTTGGPPGPGPVSTAPAYGGPPGATGFTSGPPGAYPAGSHPGMAGPRSTAPGSFPPPSSTAGGPMSGSVGGPGMPPRGPVGGPMMAAPTGPAVSTMPGMVARPGFGPVTAEPIPRPSPGVFTPSSSGPGGMPGVFTPSPAAPTGMNPAMGGQPGMAAPAPLPPPDINENFQCSPAYMALTVGAIPANATLAKRAALPFGLCVHPLAEGDGTLGRNGVPVVNFEKAGVVRCKQCRAYINPFSKFIDGGKRWKCNFCGFINDIPDEYFVGLTADGNRADLYERPELCQGSVEFIAPAEYMVRPPQPPVYVFVIDVSVSSVSAGILHTACAAILSCLDALPGDDRTQVGIITFDSSIHFYNLNDKMRAPQMMIVADTSDLFLPVPEELLVNLAESRMHVESLLQRLPGMFASARSPNSALGPALDAAFQVMQHIGGKMVVIQGTLPNEGPGKLRVRETQKHLGSEREHELLAPDSEEGGQFYKAKAIEFSRQQISVDMFLFAQPYADVASLGALSRYTAGQVYYYPRYTPATDAARFEKDLTRDLTRTTGFEAVMRIRASKGVSITNFYGNFFIRGTDLLALPNVTCDTAFNVELAVQEGLQPNSVVALQAALLYTTSSGERRINVHTMCKPVTGIIADMFKGVSVDAVANMIAKVALDHALRTGLQAARTYLQRAVVDIIRAYRQASATPAIMPGGPRAPAPSTTAASDINSMLPDNLMLLPLYTLGMQKCTLYRGGEHIRTDERAALVYRMLTMPIPATQSYVYPRMYSLHDMAETAGRPLAHAELIDPAEMPVGLPAVVNLSAARLVQNGIFLLDSGVELYLWTGKLASPDLIGALYGVQTLEGVDMTAVTLQELPNDFSYRVRAIIRTLQGKECQYQQVRCVREGARDIHEMRFMWHMIEDRQEFRGGNVTYAEFIPQIFAESQRQQIGGSDPIHH